MNNPIQIMKTFLGSGGSPQQLISKIMGNSNPVLNNLVKMAETGDTKSIENFAKNLFKEKGRDFDSEFSQFMSNFR